MKMHSLLIVWLLAAMLGLAVPARADTSAPDEDLTVTPVIRLFPVTSLGQDSPAAVFTITNHNTTQTRTLETLSLSGTHASQFFLGTDGCSGSTLAVNGGHCTVSVRFHPTSRGTKGAMLLIPSDDVETPTLTAFVTNSEAAATEAMRRMPPVLTAVNIPDPLTAGTRVALTWSLEGYHSGYTCAMVLFDCTEAAADCGSSYGDITRFAESGVVIPESIEEGNWQFSGVSDHRFNYSWTFDVPAKRKDGISDWALGGTEIVVRFYSKDDIDQERNQGSVSLMIPGNVAGQYYDVSGRRIVKHIVPSGG